MTLRSLRSQLAALEQQIRRRQQRGYSVKPVTPKLSFDETDPQYRAVSARLAELRGGQPVHDHRAFARKVMQDPDLARRVRAVIDRALDAAPVHLTGAWGHE